MRVERLARAPFFVFLWTEAQCLRALQGRVRSQTPVVMGSNWGPTRRAVTPERRDVEVRLINDGVKKMPMGRCREGY